jgi:predicted TIM-barrel fold metal-dependent hydrolase
MLIKNSLAAIDGLNLSKNDKEKVLGGNAAEILGLGAA